MGTIHLYRPTIQRLSGSDPSEVANENSEQADKIDVSKDSTLRLLYYNFLTINIFIKKKD